MCLECGYEVELFVDNSEEDKQICTGCDKPLTKIPSRVGGVIIN